jgi:hypothetical protein
MIELKAVSHLLETMHIKGIQVKKKKKNNQQQQQQQKQGKADQTNLKYSSTKHNKT